MSFPQSTPEVARWCALIVAIVLLFPTVIAVGSAVNAEWTGTALYSSSPRDSASVPVTRAASPEKFRHAVLMDCLSAGFFGSLTVVSFSFFRRLSD